MNEEVHRVQRRLVNHVYSIASIKDLEPYVDSAVAHFIGILSGKQNQALDLGLWLQLFAFGEPPRCIVRPLSLT